MHDKLRRATQTGKHQRILRAAIKVFARKGFYNARVSEIAREAGVADGTIYLYFRNKDDILIRLFEVEMDWVIQAMRKEVGSWTGPIEKLRAFTRKHLQMVEEDRHLAEVIQVELRQSNKFMKNYNNEKFRAYLGILADIILEGQRAGLVHPNLNPSIAKRVIFGALDEMSTFWVFSRKRGYSVEEAAGQISDILIDGIMRRDSTRKNGSFSTDVKGGRYVREEDHLSHGESNRLGDHR